MKRLIILLFISIASLYAEIGEITAINGKAVILRGELKIDVKQQSKIEEKDIIKTMKNTKLQIVFKDNTVISLGQKTTFEIEEYLYSQKKQKAKFNISKGLFKSITGKIGHIAPKNFKLKTQNATIGVRGTTIIGETTKDIDTIICSSGKIVVSSQGNEVAVNMGEKTVIKRGGIPTPAIKLEDREISQMDEKINPAEIGNITTKEEILSTPIDEKNEITKISNIKDQWGDWNKEGEITKELENNIPASEDKPQTETKPPLASLQALRDRAGTSNPTYSGKVSGFIDTPINKISNEDNHINLDFDLGDGTMKGDMGFRAAGEKWSADIKNGTVDKRGQFDFDISNNQNSINGSGDGMLSGKELQNADGTFRVQNSNNRQAFGTFSAKKN